jgi:hypothetical protein
MLFKIDDYPPFHILDYLHQIKTKGSYPIPGVKIKSPLELEAEYRKLIEEMKAQVRRRDEVVAERKNKR